MKRIFLVMLGALATAGSLKAEVVESHGYFISSEDAGKFTQTEVHQLPTVSESRASEVKPASEPVVESGNAWVGVIECVLLVSVAGAVALVFYFLPSIIAKSKRNFGAIFVLNLLTGWSFIGWVIAIVWACTTEAEKVSASDGIRHVSELGQ